MGLWDDLKGLANDINNSQFMGDVKEMIGNAARQMAEENAEKQAVLKFYADVERLYKERNITDSSSREAGEAMIEVFRALQVWERPNGILNRVYGLIMEKQQERSQPVSGETCGSACMIDKSYCEECRALYKQARDAVAMINNPEAYKAKYALSKEQDEEEDTNCRFCGAPMEETEQICEYCGTRKSGFKPLQIKVNSWGEVPSAVEYAAQATFAYRNFLAQQTNDYAYRLAQAFVELEMYKYVYSTNLDTLSANAGLQEVKTGESAIMLKRSFEAKLIPMSETDVYRAAGEMNLPIDVYLRGYMDGSMENWAGIQVNQQNEALRKQRKEEHEQKMAAMRAQTERQIQSNREFWERRRSMYQAPQYSGGGGGGGSTSSGRCCAGCALYNTNDARCARDGRKRTASESCGWFTWK